MIKKKKRGSVLAENLVFIILNLVFISILLIFITTKANSASEVEERYAKQIALMLDGAKSGSFIFIKGEDLIDKKAESYKAEDLIKIQGNQVFVKLVEKGGYSYSFFNNGIEPKIEFLGSGNHEGDYKIFIDKKTVNVEDENE